MFLVFLLGIYWVLWVDEVSDENGRPVKGEIIYVFLTHIFQLVFRHGS